MLAASKAHGASAPLERKRARVSLAPASESGVFEGYASLFNVVDTGGDMVMPGAFAKSLRLRGAASVKMLWQHQAAEPIGVWALIVEDGRGLKVQGRLDLSVGRAREALSLMRAGAIDGLSIGFRTKREGADKSGGVRRLIEVDLWEISIVTFPMLPQARVSAVKRASSRSSPCSFEAEARRRGALGASLARLRARNAATAFELELLRLARSLERR
jgi:HK97 family phage prohead protease